MDTEKQTRRDWLGRCEAGAKTLAALCMAFGAVAIPILVNRYAEESHRTEAYMKILTEREQADTTIRQEMFKTLLSGYLTDLKRKDESSDAESFRREIMLLRLLVLNFQEFFNAKPLFEDVFDRLEQQRTSADKTDPKAKEWRRLEHQLIGAAKSIAGRQSLMLNSRGAWPFLVSKGSSNCVWLYPVGDQDRNGQCEDTTTTPPGQLPEGYTTRTSLKIGLSDVKPASVRVTVTVYYDRFEGNTYTDTRAGNSSDFEVSFFDLPYIDNTQLADGQRYALRLTRIIGETAYMEAIVFKNDFMSVRDRPALGQTLQKLRNVK